MLKKPPSHLFSDEIPTRLKRNLPLPWPSTQDLGDYDVKTLYLGTCHESSSPLQQDPGLPVVLMGDVGMLGKVWAWCWGLVSVLEMDKRLEING